MVSSHRTAARHRPSARMLEMHKVLLLGRVTEAPWAWALVPVSLVMSRTVHGTGSRTRYKVYGPGTGNWCASRYIIT